MGESKVIRNIRVRFGSTESATKRNEGVDRRNMDSIFGDFPQLRHSVAIATPVPSDRFTRRRRDVPAGAEVSPRISRNTKKYNGAKLQHARPVSPDNVLLQYQRLRQCVADFLWQPKPPEKSTAHWCL